MTLPADAPRTSPSVHADEVPTQFDSSFAEDAAESLRDEHWTAGGEADSSIDSALARFEQASMAFAVVARAARAGAPPKPAGAGADPAPSADADAARAEPAAPPSTAEAAEPGPPGPAAAVAADTSPRMPDAAAVAETSPAAGTRAEPVRVALKPTPTAGRMLAPPDMVRRAFEDTMPEPSVDAAGSAGAASAGAGTRLMPWLTFGLAVLVAIGALAVARRDMPSTPAVAPIPPTPAPAALVTATPAVAAAPQPAAPAPPAQAEPPSPNTPAAATGPAAPTVQAEAPPRSPGDVPAAVADAQAKSDRFLAGGGAPGAAGPGSKASSAH